MTVEELAKRLASIPGTHELFVYTGPGGTRVQAEGPRGSNSVVLTSPAAVPQGGGPTE